MNEANVLTIFELSAQNDALRAEVETLEAKTGALRLLSEPINAEIESLCALIDLLRVENAKLSAKHDALSTTLLEQCGRFTVAAGEYDGRRLTVDGTKY